MSAHGGRVRVVLSALVLALLVAAVVGVEGTGVALLLAPVALLALALLFGRYPGERVIQRLACRRTGIARRDRSVSLPRPPLSLGARVGALALPGCGRAPPAGALV